MTTWKRRTKDGEDVGEPMPVRDTTDSTYSSGFTGVMVFRDEPQEFMYYHCIVL